MDDVPPPQVVLAAIIATVVAIEVGIPLAAARTEVVLPLVSKCPPILFSDLSTAAFSTHIMRCGVGLSMFVAIPGTIGIWLMTFRSR